MRLQQRLRREQGRHTDDWLITYADMITLLLCLFVIILSIRTGAKPLSRDAEPPVSQAATAPVSQAASAEDIFWGGQSFRPVIVEPVEDAPVAMARLQAAPDAPIALVAPIVPDPAPVSVEIVAPPVAPAAAPALTHRPALPDAMDRLRAQGTATVEQLGDRITTLQIGSAAVFASGSATLTNSGKSILSDVAGTLKSTAYTAYHITIEGHTDDTPINTLQFQSNWELSAARASAVVRYLLDLGIPAPRLTAAGYADTFPIASNRNADGTVIPDNQARNRRVVIRLEKIDRTD